MHCFRLIPNLFERKLFILILLPLALSSCRLGPKFKVPSIETCDKWREATQVRFTGAPVDKVEWWKVFNDPVLDKLVQDTFRQNLSLQAASLRIVQARIAQTSSIYPLYLPLMSAGGSISHVDFSTNVKPEVEVDINKRQRRLPPLIRDQLKLNLPSVEVTPELDLYDAGFDALWELDIWGRNRQLVTATSSKLGAAFADYDDIMVSLAAEMAKTYVLIRTTSQRLVAMRELYNTMNGFVTLTQERYDKKEALITDVMLAKLLTGIVETSIPPLEIALREQQNALCVLLGKVPQDIGQDIGTSGTIPSAPAQAAVGIPADLLRRRPDVRMAEYLAAAQCARVGMAKATIMPSLSVFGSIGLRSTSSEKFFRDDSVRSAYGGLLNANGLVLYPITVENVRFQDAQFEEAMLQYKDTVLRANLEVENNMYAFLKGLDESAIYEENVKLATDTVRLTEAAYKDGKAIVSIPLVALTFLASQTDQYWQWRGETTTSFIATYKALGGGWQNRVDQELIPAEIREKMKKEADWWTFTGRHDLSTKQVKCIEKKP